MCILPNYEVIRAAFLSLKTRKSMSVLDFKNCGMKRIVEKWAMSDATLIHWMLFIYSCKGRWMDIMKKSFGFFLEENILGCWRMGNRLINFIDIIQNQYREEVRCLYRRLALRIKFQHNNIKKFTRWWFTVVGTIS